MNTGTIVKRFAFISTALVIAACTQAEGPRDGFAATDPYEPTNRKIHDLNITMDRNVLRPVAQGYDYVTPTLFKHLIGNGLNHIELPKDFANYVLQGDVDASLRTLGRFTLNSILGMGGLLDPATEFGLPKETTDFGVTLGKYGVDEGDYLVVPLLGPTTVRDLGGVIVDQAFNPFTYVGAFTSVDLLGPSVGVVRVVDTRDRNKDLIDAALYESSDSYVTVRAGYLQHRRALVAGEEGALDNLPDIYEDEEDTQN